MTKAEHARRPFYTKAQQIMSARAKIATMRAAEAANTPPVDYRTPLEKARSGVEAQAAAIKFVKEG